MQDQVLEFCKVSGISGKLEIVQLRAGRNSAVFKILQGENAWVVKKYYSNPNDQRDRLGVEFDFLRFMQRNLISGVPIPIAKNNKLLMALYSFLPGQKPKEITVDFINQAANFIVEINAFKDEFLIKNSSYAVDACANNLDYFKRIDERLQILRYIDSSRKENQDAVSWIKNTLEPAWLKFCRNFELSGGVRGLSPPHLIYSPSDFGFHNTLDDNGRLLFVDFEYAGFDDLTKLTSDFICQPEIPIMSAQSELFVEILAGSLKYPDLHKKVQLLLPLHRVKWCCILLNAFNPLNQKRMLHAGIAKHGLLDMQLEKAKIYFKTYLAG